MGSGGGAYGVSLAEGVDVEESECLLGLEDLEAGDITCCGRGRRLVTEVR